MTAQKGRDLLLKLVRDGDYYALDPHDDTELDLWLFRLDLRPPRVPRLELVRAEPEPPPGPETPLTTSEVEEALGHGEDCGSRPICSDHDFLPTDWIYEVGRRDGLPWGPTLVIGFDRQGFVGNVYTLTRR